jgi:hypothetical protein
MKEKWTPHIIAVAALFVFVALGLASATASPEEQAARKAAEEARLTDGKGGVIIVRHSGNSDDSYYYLRPNHPESGPRGALYNAYKNGGSNRFVVDEDGSYTIRYRSMNNAPEPSQLKLEDFYLSKTIYVSNDQIVEVTIP